MTTGRDVLHGLALRRRGPLARWAMRRLSRRADDELLVLLGAMGAARDPGAAALARRTVEQLWSGGAEQRERVWWGVWALSEAATPDWAGGWRTLPPAVVDLIFAPEPDGVHVPRIRLVAGLTGHPPRLPLVAGLTGHPPRLPLVAGRSGHPPRLHGLSGAGDTDVAMVVWQACHAHDPAIRRRFADVLATTDHPRLLTALEEAFIHGLREHTSPSVAPPAHRLWDPDGRPTPLLQAMLDNPHLRRPHADDRHLDLALLAALTHRFDLLQAYDGPSLVDSLLDRLVERLPAPAHDACRLALRRLDRAEARDALCDLAGSGDEEALNAVTDAGYHPADARRMPLFLLLTGQWDRLLAADPDGTRLAEFLTSDALPREESGDPDGYEAVAEVLTALEHPDVPAVARHACERALRELGPGVIRDAVCAHAMDGEPRALRIALDAGYEPSDPDSLPAFLYLTEQWDRYDAADPDGSRLRSYCEAKYAWESPAPRLIEIARRVGRPLPCTPPEPAERRGYIPGGTGVSGTGGYTAHT